MAEITPEQLEQRLKAGKELLAIKEKLTRQEQEQATIIMAALARAQQILDTGNKRLDQLQLERVQLSEKDTEELAINAKRIEEQKVFAQFAREHQNEIAKVQDGLKKHAEAFSEASEKSFTDAKKGLHKLEKTSIGAINTLGDAGKALTAGVEAGVSTAAAAMAATIADPKMAAIGFVPGAKKALLDVKSSTVSAFDEIDSNLRQLTKKQGGYYDELGVVFAAAMDPMHAKRMGMDFKDLEEPIHSAGYAAEDVRGAMSAMLDSTAMFRPAFMANETAAASFMANTVVGMEKIGVSHEKSAKILNIYTKVLKQSPLDAAKSLKRLGTVAKSLGLSTSDVTQGFVTSVEHIAQWGPDMTQVFADLQAQSVGTGTAMTSLLTAAGKMDTFKGAADAAGTLNAVLGDTYVSATDLAMADPAEKMNMIRDAVARSGVDFETTDRFMRRIITTAMGFDSVADAAKVLLNKEEAIEAAEALETKVMTQEELTKSINETMTSAQQITKGLSNLAGAQKEFLDTTRPGAVKFANVITNAFAEMLGATENNLAALFLFNGVLDTTQSLATAAGASLKQAVGAIEGVTPDWFERMMVLAAGGTALAFAVPEVMTELRGGTWTSVAGEPSPEKHAPAPRPPVGVETGSEEARSAAIIKMSEWTTSMRNLTDALNNQSDVPINLNVETTMDKEVVGKGAAEFTINLITNEVQRR